VAEQVCVAWQFVPSLNVQVTVVLPPHADGAPLPAVSALIVALHPPLYVTPLSHVANSALTVDWLWHEGSVWLPGQLNVRAVVVSLVTVKLAEQVCVAWQFVPSVRVQITVVLPPHADGAPLPAVSALIVALHPPLYVTPLSHVANSAFTIAWLWHPGSV